MDTGRDVDSAESKTKPKAAANYSSDRRRAAGFVTFTPKTFALYKSRSLQLAHPVHQQVNTNIPLKNQNAVAAADVVCDLRRKAFVVHQEKVDFSYVAD